tara:strand:+ start:2647 stop:3351 length:705 start_codon:yes stop_codon:yes gene_type:complete
MTFFKGVDMYAGYGTSMILNGCSISVDKGKIAVIVGPNGAGKSTAMKALFGMLPLQNGSVFIDHTDITRLRPEQRVLSGMGYVPQTNNVFPSMTVLENLEMGGFVRRDDLSQTISEIFDLFPILKTKQDQPAGELSGGQRQQVAFARALMTKPKILMLDEPTAGVSPIVMDELFDRIIDISKTGVAIVMVEQNAKQALQIADIGYVLVQGENKFKDTGAALIRNSKVRKAFLGG